MNSMQLKRKHIHKALQLNVTVLGVSTFYRAKC